MAKKDDKFFTQSVDVSIPSQNIELDPRSVTTADGMQRNYIPTGDETEVRGTRRMLKDKKKTAKFERFRFFLSFWIGFRWYRT